MFFIKELLLKRKSKFVLYIIACFLPVISQLLSNYGLALLFGNLEIRDMDYFVKTLILVGLFVVLGSLMYLVSRFMRISYMRDVLLDIRMKAFEKILNTSFRDFSKKSKETYISNLINDINIFENTFFLKLINLIFRGGTYVTSIMVLAFIDFKFAAAIFIISILLLMISKLFQKKTISLQEEVSSENENFAIEAANTFNGLEILKLNSLEDKYLLKTVKSIDKLERKKLNFSVFTDIQAASTNLLGYFISVGILIYLLMRFESGLSFTRITFMMQLSNMSVWSMTMIPPVLNELKSSSNIYDKITKKIEGTDYEAGSREFVFNQEIEIKNLSFNYEGQEIFKDTNFTIEKGKKYLLVGASGSGKSTLINILSKTYDEYTGDIFLDGVDYREVNEDSLNENISFIYQDVFLFEDTILNNLTLFKDYDRPKLLDAVENAGLRQLIQSKDKALEEVLIENGKNLSGGERQRISIGRAIIKDSSILFVDEATSSLDEKLGRHIEETILNVDSTVIAISHRHYKGITQRYDYVLEIVDKKIVQTPSGEYFKEAVMYEKNA